MCGIAGVMHRDPERPVDADRITRMARSLRHRGPDGEGFFVQGCVGLGMRRLAIIDVAGGDQPLFNEDHSLAVVQNGEIYNYKELRAELQALGHTFRTASDTEVLVHAYEAWGDGFVERLNGMWAFALWDGGRRRLLLSRDRLGIKPLHYAWDGETLVFGSEIKALLRAGVDPEPNGEVMDAYVAFGFVPEPHSMYRHVRKLPAGCNLTLDVGGSPRMQRYWEVPAVGESDARRDEPRVVEEFAALLDDAVRLQMRSDVPLGAFLSGGLDSSSIVALASAHTPHPLRTFTMGFESAEHDERDLARLVATRYATNHLERCVVPHELESTLHTLAHHFDEPFGDSSALPTWIVCSLARERVTVVLTGDGGDEVLAGYTRYQGEKFSGSWARLPGFLRRRMVPDALALGRRLVPAGARRRLTRAARVVDAANLDFVDRLTAKQSWSDARLRAALLRGAATPPRPARDFVDEVVQACPARESFHRLNWFDLKMMLPSQMLTKVDRMSMATSLEARVPFLDHRLVELMAGVSARVKLPGYRRKHVLRAAFGSRLPSELLRARKRGFNVPFDAWVRGAGPADLLAARERLDALDGLVDTNCVRDLVERQRARKEDHTAQTWILLQLAQWHMPRDRETV